MLGVSDSSGNSSGAAAADADAAAAAAANHEGDAGVGGSINTVAADSGGSGLGDGGGEEEKLRSEEGHRNLTGNRWPRQETLALLQIRFDMDVAFRDSTLKGPLWEEVSRKLAELGYHRSGKKCKEKFENVYKYHRRIKEGRAARADGKTYRFFEQLQALDHHHPSLLPPPSPGKPLQSQSQAALPITQATPLTAAPPSNVPTHTTTPTTAAATTTTTTTTTDPMTTTSSLDSSSSSEDDSGGSRSRRRKRKKMTAFFEKLMNEVIEKQEMLQKKFLETIEKRDRERVAREEAWKVQEMARMNREHELMLHERSIAAAKDAAVIQFLKKISEQASPIQSTELQLQLHETQSQSQNPKPNPSNQPAHPAQPLNQAQPSLEKMMVEIPRPAPENAAADNFAAAPSSSSSSRWPKPEVQALISLRTQLDLKYQENGPKGPLWEEISASMKKLGYNRNAKRCKEKWENINKYFKKVKESNKKRPEDSKTCPYFHQLDALYKEKKMDSNSSSSNAALGAGMGPYGGKPLPDNMVMPLRQEPIRPQSDVESENNMDMEMERNPDQDEEDGDDEVEDEGGDYEVVAKNSSSLAIVE